MLRSLVSYNKAQTLTDIRGWSIDKSSCLGLSVHVIFCLFPCVGHTWDLSPLPSTPVHKTWGDISTAKPIPHLFHWPKVGLKHFLNWSEAGEVQTEAPADRDSHVECGSCRKPGPIHDWAHLRKRCCLCGHFSTWGTSFTLSCLSDSFQQSSSSQCSSSLNASLKAKAVFITWLLLSMDTHEHKQPCHPHGSRKTRFCRNVLNILSTSFRRSWASH